MRNISFIITICALLIISVVSFAFALSGISYEYYDKNVCYVVSKNNPDVKFYISDVDRFVKDIVSAIAHRNDHDELVLVGDLVHVDGKYTHKYEVLTGNGEVHIYLYKLLDNDFGDELYITLTNEQIEQIINSPISETTISNEVSKYTPSMPNIQTVSTLANIANNIDADDIYGTMTGLGRLTSANSVKETMLMYHPILHIKDTLDDGVNIHNITELYSNILYLLK